MVIDMNYWTKVFRKLVLLILSFITIYLSFKLAFFYMPFNCICNISFARACYKIFYEKM